MAKSVTSIRVYMEDDKDPLNYEEITFDQREGIKIKTPEGTEIIQDDMTEAIITQMNSMMSVMASNLSKKGPGNVSR